MSEKGRVLAIFPARAGSRGLPRKNLLFFNGKPLIQWTIEAALGTPEIDEVVVTSDDD
jgi:CMP-N,N'-diacetyllegionaminic acid synthase